MKIALKIIVLILTITLLTGCNNNEDKLLKEDSKVTSNESEILKRDNILFGKKTGENELNAGNVFKVGEDINFYVKIKNEITTKEVTVILRKGNKEKWEEVTRNKLPVNGTWKEFMNGISGNIFEQIGTGSYQLEINHKGKVLAKGKFVVEEK